MFAGIWLGAAVCLTFGNLFLSGSPSPGLAGITMALKFIDDFIIIPGAIGCLLTGVLYAVLTHWGWFKYRWITVKWIITILGIFFGTFFLGPWQNTLPPIALAEGTRALQNPMYIDAHTMVVWGGTLQAVSLLLAVFISSLKPWRKPAES
jgi:hypothetical protein